MNFNLGNLSLNSPFFLSPLAGYTNLPFRRVIREIGGVGLCTTDLVNARSLLEKNRKALKLIGTMPSDQPLAVQIFGSSPEEMRDAALYLESLNYASVDVNMGCPVNKVCSVGGGSAMMLDWRRSVDLVQKMIEAIQIPVTCKMRLGWDYDQITAPDLSRALADVGVAAIFVHGRTREQGFTGQVNLEGIRRVVEAVPEIPVIGNGDVTTPQGAKLMFEQTGCAGVSVGRGAFYNPWIFQDILYYLKTDQLRPEAGFEERIQIMRRHLDFLIEFYGEALGCKMFRKMGPWYAKRLGPNAEFNAKITRLETRLQFDEIIHWYRTWRCQFLDEKGELLPVYRPRPLESAFAYALPCKEHSLPAAQREAIPVPSGPVEFW